MSRATATAPPVETGGSLQGQLHLLSERVLAQARRDASLGAESSSSNLPNADASRVVTKLQRRALEVLLRFDDNLNVDDIDASERAERNALRLGMHALSMRTRGDEKNADLLESLHDAFVSRRALTVDDSPGASQTYIWTDIGRDGAIVEHTSTNKTTSLTEHANALALLLSLANSGSKRDATKRASVSHEQSHNNDLPEFASRRAARAAQWLQLTPIAAFEGTPVFGSLGSTGEYGQLGMSAENSNEGLRGSVGFTAPPRLDVAPTLGGLGEVSSVFETSVRVAEDEFVSRDENSNDERSLFGALHNARVPIKFDEQDKLDIALALGDTTPDREVFVFQTETVKVEETNTTRPGEGYTQGRGKGNGNRSVSEKKTGNPWLAALDSENGKDGGASVFGWDTGDGVSVARHACDAFLAGGEDAFGDAYVDFVRPTARIFGAAKPARATQDELVQATRAALAGGRAVARALVPKALEHDAPRKGGDPPPLRLPAASAGSVAGALQPLAEAAEDRAALDRFVRRVETGDDGAGPMDLATQAAASETREVLRAHDAALLALPVAAAARRADELAADENGPNGSQLAAPYRLTTSNAPVTGVTLLEARAHTRALRGQLATLRLLCAPEGGNVSGLATLRRVFATLISGGAGDVRERNLLRRLLSAAAAPAMAQAREWTRCAVLDDPRGEFFIAVSGEWGASVNELELTAPETSIESWRRRALQLDSTSNSVDTATSDTETKEALEDENTNSGETVDLRSVPPWRGGPPGRVRDGASVSKHERASLRIDLENSTDKHPLFAGVERDALATGVHLRILQRLPQTAQFARETAALDDERVSTSTNSTYKPWGLAFDSDTLSDAERWRRETCVKMEQAAQRAMRAMAVTRDAEVAREEARRRAIRAAVTARRLEKDLALETAKAGALEDFAERMAALASRRAQEAFARRCVTGNETLDPGSSEPNDSSTDEVLIQKALDEALSVTERLAPGSATPKRLTKTKGIAEGALEEALEESDATPIGLSPNSYFRGTKDDDLDSSFRTAHDTSIDVDAPTTPGAILDDVATPSRNSEELLDTQAHPVTSPQSVSPSVSITPYPDSLDGRDKSFSSHEGTLLDSIEGSGDVTSEQLRLSDVNRRETTSNPTRDVDTLQDTFSLETPLPVILDTCVTGPIRDRRLIVSKLVADTFMSHLGLEYHCDAIADYLLCGAGDFATAFVERVSSLANRDSRYGCTSGGLNDALDSARRTSSALTDPLAQRVKITVRVPGGNTNGLNTNSGIQNASFSEHSLGMVDFFDASYQLEWPLGFLFPSNTRSTLSATHRQLLKFRHVTHALSEAHQLVHEAGVDSVSAYKHGGERGISGKALAQRRLRRLSLLSFELRHFVSCLEGYAGEGCHGTTTRVLKHALRDIKTHQVKPKDAYQIRGACVSFVDACASFCFLSERDEPLRQAIDGALQLALDFRKTVRNASTGLLTDGTAYASLQATHATFKIAVKHLCVRLADAASDIGGSLGGVSPTAAAALLNRIDHNGFYRIDRQ